jgi:hypothetical protein
MKSSLPNRRDYKLWPLQIQQYSYGWMITYYGQTGQVLHLANATSEIQAYRNAYIIAQTYEFEGEALVISSKGIYPYDVIKLLKR